MHRLLPVPVVWVSSRAATAWRAKDYAARRYDGGIGRRRRPPGV